MFWDHLTLPNIGTRESTSKFQLWVRELVLETSLCVQESLRRPLDLGFLLLDLGFLDLGSWIMNYELWIMSYELWIMNYDYDWWLWFMIMIYDYDLWSWFMIMIYDYDLWLWFMILIYDHDLWSWKFRRTPPHPNTICFASDHQGPMGQSRNHVSPFSALRELPVSGADLHPAQRIQLCPRQ